MGMGWTFGFETDLDIEDVIGFETEIEIAFLDF